MKSLVAGILALMAAGSKKRGKEIIKAGVLQPVVAILSARSDSAEQAADLLTLLGNYDEASRVMIVNAGALQPLAKLVIEGSNGLQDVAHHALMMITGSIEEYLAQIEVVSIMLDRNGV